MESRALKLTQLLFSKLRDSRSHALKDIAAARLLVVMLDG